MAVSVTVSDEGAFFFFNLKNFFWPWCLVFEILAPPLGIKPTPPAAEVQSPSRWAAREVLKAPFSCDWIFAHLRLGALLLTACLLSVCPVRTGPRPQSLPSPGRAPSWAWQVCVALLTDQPCPCSQPGHSPGGAGGRPERRGLPLLHPQAGESRRAPGR